MSVHDPDSGNNLNGSQVEVNTKVLAELIAQLLDLDLADLLDGSGASKVLQLAHKIYNDLDEVVQENVDALREMLRRQRSLQAPEVIIKPAGSTQSSKNRGPSSPSLWEQHELHIIEAQPGSTVSSILGTGARAEDGGPSTQPDQADEETVGEPRYMDIDQ